MKIGQRYSCPNCTTEYTATGTCHKCCTPGCQVEWNKKNIPKYQECRTCKITYPVRFFSFRHATGKYMRVCQECLLKQRHVNHPPVPQIKATMPVEKYRTTLRWTLRDRYDMSLEEYTTLWMNQKGRCAICKLTNEETSTRCTRLFVDHCHTTKEVRGLLCQKCNTGLGVFNDKPELLYQAICYLGGEELVLDKAVDRIGGDYAESLREIERGK